MPLEVALPCKLHISQLDPDESVCLVIQGQPLDIRGQVRAVAHINSISEPLHFRAIVVTNFGDREVILDLHTLIIFKILPSSWTFHLASFNIAKTISEKELYSSKNKMSYLSAEIYLRKNEVPKKYPVIFKNELGQYMCFDHRTYNTRSANLDSLLSNLISDS